MNEIGSRKVFDRTLYEIADRDAKSATLKYIKILILFAKHQKTHTIFMK